MPEARAPYLVVVARGQAQTWESLSHGLGSWALDRVEMLWDRRVGQRRWRPAVPGGERRHGDRRAPTDVDAFGCIVASRVEGTCAPCVRVGR
jgi:hypothetical protein